MNHVITRQCKFKIPAWFKLLPGTGDYRRGRCFSLLPLRLNKEFQCNYYLRVQKNVSVNLNGKKPISNH